MHLGTNVHAMPRHSTLQAEKSVLTTLTSERDDFERGTIARLRDLTAEISGLVHRTAFSTWLFHRGPQLQQALDSAAQEWASLTPLFSAKCDFLEDAHQCQLFAEKTCLMAEQHTDKVAKLLAWAQEKRDVLLGLKESTTSAEAASFLSQVKSLEEEQVNLTGTSYVSLKQLGLSIADRTYESVHHSSRFENVAALKQQEKDLEVAWARLQELVRSRAQLGADLVQRHKFMVRLNHPRHVLRATLCSSAPLFLLSLWLFAFFHCLSSPPSSSPASCTPSRPIRLGRMSSLISTLAPSLG